MLKKIVVTVFVVFLFSDISFAGGSITMQSNSINPKHGRSMVSHDVNAYIKIGEKLGLGVEATTIPQNDFLSVKPLATWSLDNGWGVNGGYKSDNIGNEYVLGGVSYAGKIGQKNSLYASVAYYEGLEAKSKDYVDSFVELRRELGHDFSLALEIAHDWWPETGANWLLAGPVLHYKANNSLDVFVRVAGETCFNGNASTDIRIGLTYLF